MTDSQQLADIKEQINVSIRRNSDRGFIPYSGCNRICAEMYSILQQADEHTEPRQAFDIYILILLKMMKLISHADTSSGAAGDVIQSCLDGIDKLCRSADEANHNHFFDTIIKTAKNKAFQGWPGDGYRLLQSAVYFVRDKKQAQKILNLFPTLGTFYDGRPYPEQLLITLAIIERLDGVEAAERYLMEHIDVPELRMVAVDKAFAAKQYSLAEKLCREALEKNIPGHFNRPSPWAYYLERLYAETDNREKLTETVRLILFQRDISYFKKLKEIYLKQGVWEDRQEQLWQELSIALPAHEYASLLAKEGKMEKLLEVVKRHPTYVLDYGQQLASCFPDETYVVYEEYILAEAQEATDRRKYRQVCRMIKEFAAAGAKEKVVELIDRLREIYHRRPAMSEELSKLKKSI